MKRDLAVVAVAAGSILNIYPSMSYVKNLPPVSTGQYADTLALASDWVSIGNDLKKSMDRYGSEQIKQK